jgi:uncharacterized protein (DUF2345 family)
MKELTGGASASASTALKAPGKLYDEQFQLMDELSGLPLAGEPYRILDSSGTVVAQGLTNHEGKTVRHTSLKADTPEGRSRLMPPTDSSPLIAQPLKP